MTTAGANTTKEAKEFTAREGGISEAKTTPTEAATEGAEAAADNKLSCKYVKTKLVTGGMKASLEGYDGEKAYLAVVVAMYGKMMNYFIRCKTVDKVVLQSMLRLRSGQFQAASCIYFCRSCVFRR